MSQSHGQAKPRGHLLIKLAFGSCYLFLLYFIVSNMNYWGWVAALLGWGVAWMQSIRHNLLIDYLGQIREKIEERTHAHREP